MTASRRSAGFTLVEGLIVIAIVGVLVAIVVPIVGTARPSASETKCANNLHLIFAAATAQKASTGGRPSRALRAEGWYSELLPYVPNEDVYFCPDATSAYAESYSPGMMVNPDGTLSPMAPVSNTTTTSGTTVSAPPSLFNPGDLESLGLYIHAIKPISNNSGPFYCDIPFKLGTSPGPTTPKGFKMAKQIDENTQEWSMEDGCDSNWTDCELQIEDYAPDDIVITFLRTQAGDVGYTFMDANGTPLATLDRIGGFKPATKPGAMINLPVDPPQRHAGSDSSNAVGPTLVKKVHMHRHFLKKDPGTYGMNVGIASAGADTRRKFIFMLDYPRPIADPLADIGQWESTGMGNWLESDGTRVFDRHNQGLNVTFYDGTVKRTRSSEIDPSTTLAYQTYWKP